ncbi:GNAT family protein [Phytohabitans sp. ZYX-F-186]|uniref:GNAT family protein n=1 Tax=Phytohabitans maris TaxID=3071409 RepID=A0ABU0ZMB4_9ACTN|nr:GNAT family protein [Phytohabitans sp. ZYX-F-186]MDQ7907776.1 GNAT family protein [Phytohabitans sp. ZYX-F-186]
MIVIHAGGVRLRPFHADDVDDLAAGYAEPNARAYTRDDATHWITHGAPSAWAAGGAAYAIADPATDRLIGGVGISRVVPERSQGEIGYWVVRWARGRGVATAAARALTAWAFDRGFSRLELLTNLANAPSQRVALAAGFQREGIRRSGGQGAAGRYDMVVWARLAGDPPGPTRRLLPDLPGGALFDGVVTLRPIVPDDAAFLHALLSLPDVAGTSLPPIVPDREEVELRCARAEGWWLAGERADLAITDARTGTPAGTIGLYYEDPRTTTAGIGYAMLPAWRGRGMPTRAVRLLARWALGTAGIGRLTAGTLPGNAASQRVLEKAGFRREGYLRGRLPGISGTRVDDVVYGLLAADLARDQTDRAMIP